VGTRTRGRVDATRPIQACFKRLCRHPDGPRGSAPAFAASGAPTVAVVPPPGEPGR